MDRPVKTTLVACALTAALATPGLAQIAKFHVMAPAVPSAGLIKKTSSDDIVGAFVGNTVEMKESRAASLDEMREAAPITASASEPVDANGEDRLGVQTASTSRISTEVGNPGGPKGENAGSEEVALGTLAMPEPRPTFERQVIVRTRTKGTRSGSKIRTGGYWSVGEFR